MVRDDSKIVLMNQHSEGDTGLFLNEDGVAVGAWTICTMATELGEKHAFVTDAAFDIHEEYLKQWLKSSDPEMVVDSSISRAYEITVDGLVRLSSDKIGSDDYTDSVIEEIASAGPSRFFLVEKSELDSKPLLLGYLLDGKETSSDSVANWRVSYGQDGEVVKSLFYHDAPGRRFVFSGKE